MADALAASQQAVGELKRVEADVAVNGLEPFGGVAGGALQLEHLDPAFGFIGDEARIQIFGFGQGFGETDGVLEGQFCAGADGEMRRVGGVAQQHHLAVAPVGAGHAREVQPGRAAQVFRIAQQGVAAQPVGEQGLGRAAGLVVVHRVEAEAAPGRF